MVKFATISALCEYFSKSWQYGTYQYYSPNKRLQIDSTTLYMIYKDSLHVSVLFADNSIVKKPELIEVDTDNNIIVIDEKFAFKYA